MSIIIAEFLKNSSVICFLYLLKKLKNWIPMSINAQLFDQKKTDDRTFIEDCDKNSDRLRIESHTKKFHLLEIERGMQNLWVGFQFSMDQVQQ